MIFKLKKSILHKWRREWLPSAVFLPGYFMDRGAWWAAVYGVGQRRTRLKRLSSSSGSSAILGLLSRAQRFAAPWIGSSVHGYFPARTQQWVAIFFSRRSSRPRDRACVSSISCTAGRFFTTEIPGKPLFSPYQPRVWYILYWIHFILFSHWVNFCILEDINYSFKVRKH